MKLLYSVVIPALNEEKFLPHLLESLAAQTRKNFQIIVVDGSSTDKTVQVARAYKKKLTDLRIIVSPKASLPLQRNLGANEASGEWLVFIDADSVLMPYFFARVHTYIQAYHPRLLTTWFRPDSEVNGDAVLTILGNLLIETSKLMKKPMAPGPLTLVKREAYDLVNGYDEEHEFHEDIDFGMRLAKAGVPLSILKETLYIWSIRRWREQGSLKVIQQHAKSILPLLFFNRTVKKMPGYIMGGQIYRKKKQPQGLVLKEYEMKLKKLMKELLQ